MKQEIYDTLDDMKELPCMLPFSHPDYAPPSHVDLAELMRLGKLSNRDAGLLCGFVTNEKGCSTIVKAKRAPDRKDAKPLPYSAWRTLVEHVGLSTTEDAKACLYHLAPALSRRG